MKRAGEKMDRQYSKIRHFLLRSDVLRVHISGKSNVVTDFHSRVEPAERVNDAG
jgi:hypothetical protein